ncbi:hypothetical protein BKA82DRAFT_4351871 [Pisolithus tinctorius]|nr:hypothetical protein BKA82DRAFT_4351871 [Pisolithus tinctorius]
MLADDLTSSSVMSTSNFLPSECASETINSFLSSQNLLGTGLPATAHQIPSSSPNLITETGTAILGTGLLATAHQIPLLLSMLHKFTGVPAMAISQEVYVVNEETVVTAGTFILPAYIAKLISGPDCD